MDTTTGEEKYRKAMEAMHAQMTRMKSEIETERSTKVREVEDLKRKLDEESGRASKLQKFHDERVEERKREYNRVFDNLTPYLSDQVGKFAVENDDKRAMDHVTSLGNSLREAVNGGVTDPAGEDQLLVLQACASLQKHTSSSLEKALKTEREWASKYEQIFQRLTDQETKFKDAVRERDELKLKYTASINNATAHFTAEPPPVQIEAVASAKLASGERDFSCLFDRPPSNDWRSLFPEPAPYFK